MREVDDANTSQDSSAKAGEIAQEIVKILVNEDSETRRRAMQAAMVLLGEGWPSLATAEKGLKRHDSDGDEQVDLATFFGRDEKLRPSDCAHLCAAYHFATYGTAAFSIQDLRSIAADAGVILPDRLDKTLTHAAKNGKKLFQAAGNGAFKPTASAGLIFKERWGVKPGNKAKIATAAKE